MKRILLLLVSWCVTISLPLFAQSFSVKGKVVSDEDNEPLIGVSVVEAGSGNGVIADMHGNYQMELKGSGRKTLTFSYVGMQSQTHEVTSSTHTLNVRLKPDAQVVDEVVVVAYGVRKKGTIAGSVATVKSDKLADIPAPSFDQALQRQAPGLMNTAERIAYEREVGLDKGKDYSRLELINTNWLKEVFSNSALLQSYDLQVDGATDRLRYYVSGNFYDQDGVAVASGFRRYTVRTNLEAQAKPWLKVGTNIMLTYEKIQQADQGSYSTVTPISAARFMLPR